MFGTSQKTSVADSSIPGNVMYTLPYKLNYKNYFYQPSKMMFEITKEYRKRWTIELNSNFREVTKVIKESRKKNADEKI